MDNLQEDTKTLPALSAGNKRTIIFSIIAFVVFLFIAYVFFLSPPRDFPAGEVIRVDKGSTVSGLARELEERNIIRSELLFKVLFVFFGAESRLRVGDYLFEEKVSVWSVAKRIARGEYYTAPVVLTIPEGYTVLEIADLSLEKLSLFDKHRFLAAAREGYLFPDTYYFFSTDMDIEVIESMTENFEKKLAPLRAEIERSGRTEHEIIIMASLIEKEAKGDMDRARISGILWKRFDEGMRLQADAAPETYEARGLPKDPISNPGLEAIKAAIHPESSPYLYYLHDKSGNIYYAKTFDEHRNNIVKYLR